jgi:hypothetical protein
MPALTLADVEASDIVFGCMMLIAIVVAGTYFALWLRRRIWGSDEGIPVPPSGFTLGDLRTLHRNGQMSDAEFERAKEKVVAAAQRATAAATTPVDKKRAAELDRLLGGSDVLPYERKRPTSKPPESDSR